MMSWNTDLLVAVGDSEIAVPHSSEDSTSSMEDTNLAAAAAAVAVVAAAVAVVRRVPDEKETRRTVVVRVTVLENVDHALVNCMKRMTAFVVSRSERK